MSTNIGTYSISDVENELQGMMHGTTLNLVTDEFGIYNRAARRVLEDVDPQETKIVTQFGQIFDGVYDYALPVDVKGNKVIDLYPPANRQLSDDFGQAYNKEFDLWKNFSLVPDFTPRYAGGLRTVRINATQVLSGVQMNAADGVQTNGVWSVGGDASNIQSNNLYFTNGAAGSVSFQLNQGGSAGTVQNSSMGVLNLSQNYDNAYFFFWVYLPNASVFTSIDFRVGSSPTAYWEKTGITTAWMGNAFVNGWNLIGFPWSDIVNVTSGSPNNQAIDFLYVKFHYNGTLQTNVLINQFYSRLGVIVDIEYYSKYLFRDATTGVFQEKVTDASNVVNLDTDGYNLFLFAAGIEMVQQIQGLDAQFADQPNFEQRYQAALNLYRTKYKSELTKPRKPYYTPPAQGYRRWLGWGYRGPV